MADDVSARAVMAEFHDGDERGWVREFAHLLATDGPHLSELLLNVSEHGFQQPILLGTDRRIWDGHHRLLVALLLGIPIPAEQAAQHEGQP